MRPIPGPHRIPPSGGADQPFSSSSCLQRDDYRLCCPPVRSFRRALSLARSAVVVLSFCGIGPAPGAEAATGILVFGPETFERSPGAPQAQEAVFSACEAAAPFRLVVLNGDPDGGRRASSASIRVNGEEVLGPDRFNRRVGQVAVPLAALPRESRLSVELRSQPGARITVSVEAAGACLRVEIEEPGAGARVPDRVLLVRGVVEPPEGDLGVTVNTVVAPVVQGHFAVLVPLVAGENRIQARVLDVRGNQAEDVVLIHAEPPIGEPPLDLEVSPREGLAPLTVHLRAVPRIPAAQGIMAVDFDGDGLDEQSGPGVDGATFSYPQEGVYVVRVVQTNPDGSQVAGHLVVNVIPRPDLEDRWQQMRGLLAGGDIERALIFFLARSRDEYRRQFSALANAGALLEVANDLGNFRCNRFLPGAAECDLRVVRSGKEYSFPVIFERDTDAIWRIRSF